MKTTAGPMANHAWHMLALHMEAEEITQVCHKLMLQSAIFGHDPARYAAALDEVMAE